jgi:hypothetical protein
MKHFSILLLIVAAILAAGCAKNKAAAGGGVTIIGSGEMVTQEVAVSDFDRLEIGFSFDVTVRQGEDFNVVATADDNLVDYLYLVVEDGTLQVGLKPGFAYDIPAATMRAEVVMPHLAGLIMSGSSHVKLVDVETVAEFTAELSGSSALEGSLDVQAAEFTLAGSTLARLSGSGRQVSVDICGNSFIDLREFQVEDAAVKASCNATVWLNLEGRLTADASQFAQVIYKGQADLSGSETVEHASVRPE